MDKGQRTVRRYSLSALLLALFSFQFGSAHAAMVGTDALLSPLPQEQQRSRLLDALADEQVRERLLQLGADPQTLERRIAQLTPDELTALNGKVDVMAAGGDIVGLLLVLFIVFVITDALGATDIFPFVHPID